MGLLPRSVPVSEEYQVREGDMSAEKAVLPGNSVLPVEVEWGALSHVGKVRMDNEDHYLVAAFERSMRALLTNLPEGEIPSLFTNTAYGMLVADGMGGVAGGEVASRTAICALIELVLRTPDWIMHLNNELANKVLQRLNQRIKEAEVTLIEKARMDPTLSGMGTTLTVACSLGSSLLIAHVGDSRAYLFRDGQLYRLTRDHTMAQALADLGVIDPEEIESHPLRHMLTQVVGGEGADTQAELSILQLTDADQILLCTDGLTDMVSDAAIAKSLAIKRPVADSCRSLIEMALDGGGQDNVTVVLVRYRILPAS
jgi:serine/threonine protein phosphatase PrpC